MNLLREYIRETLNEQPITSSNPVNEGFLDFLGNLFDGLSTAFASALEIDTGKLKMPTGGTDGFNPKEDVVDQIWAVSAITQSVGYAVGDNTSFYLETVRDILETSNVLKELPQSNEELTEFSEEFETVVEYIAQSFGEMVGWLIKSAWNDQPWFQKFAEVGKAAKPGKNASETLKNMATAVQQLEAFNIPAEVKTIMTSDAVKAVLAGSDQRSEDAKNAAQDIPKFLENVQKMDYLKTLMDEIYPRVQEIENVMGKVAVEEEEPTEQSSLLAHHIPSEQITRLANESVLHEYIRELLTEVPR